MTAANRPDLLAYLERYAAAGDRRLWQVERWRRRALTGRQIAAAAEAVAGELHDRGVGPGDRVGLYLGDGPLWAAVYFGILRCGAVAVPLDVALPGDLLSGLFDALQLRAWCTDAEIPGPPRWPAPVVLEWSAAEAPSPGGQPPWPPPDPEGVAQIVLTSGTTDVPRSVPVRHRNLRAVLDALEAEIDRYRWGLRAAPAMRLAVSLPLSHLYGQVMGIYLPLLLGAEAALVASLPSAVLARRLREQRAWVLATVPRTLAMLAKYLQHRGQELWGEAGLEARRRRARAMPWYRRWWIFDPLRSLLGRRLFALVSGGATLDPALETFWRDLGYLVIQGYGLTEAAPLVTLNHPLRPSPGTLGRPLPGVEVRLGADGEILVRGPNVIAEGSASGWVDEEGWLHTGDLGRLGEDGTIRFVGRSGDRIVTPAGVNVDLEAVAARLRQQAGVLDAVAMERPWGGAGVVCAVLLLHPGCDAAAAVRRANARLPDAARVRVWFAWPDSDFPRTSTGKPRRKPILEWLRRQAPAPPGAGTTAPEAPLPPGGPPPDAGAAELVMRLVREAGGPLAPGLGPEARLGDLLTSLERVELAARIEQDLGVALEDEAFAGECSIGELATALAAAGRQRPETPGPPGRGPKVAPPRVAAAPRDPDLGTVPAAPWRLWPPVRVARWALREVVMAPLFAAFARLRVRGTCHPAALRPPFLVAANHVSLMDPAALLFALPRALRGRVAPAAMWEHFRSRRSGLLQYRFGVLGLNLFPLIQQGDWRPSLRLAGLLADHGYCPLIYPEGVRSRDGRPGRFRPGIAILSQELHLPVLPCGAAGLHRILPLGAWWPRRPLLQRPTVAVLFGEPLAALRAGQDRDAWLRELERRVAELHREALGIAGAL